MRGRFRTRLALTFLRVVIGLVFITHGMPKLIAGASGIGGMLSQAGIPLAGFLGWAVTLLEVGGGALFALGIWTRPIALLLTLHLAAGIGLVHAPQGWFVVGPGQGGIEYNVVLIAALVAVSFSIQGYGLGRRGEDRE